VLDIKKVREDFCLNRSVRGKPFVYLDSAASALKPKMVVDVVSKHYREEASNIHRGVHFFSEQATTRYEQCREKVRDFINASSSNEVIFTSGTTASINLVAMSYGSFLNVGDEVILSEMEHHSNIVPWQMLSERTGCVIKVVPINNEGELIYDKFLELLSPKTKIVSMVWCSNSLGTVNPIKNIIRDAHNVGAVVLIDAAQAIVHEDVDVQSLDCDFLAFSGHKLYAPTGVGVLYGKRSLLDKMPPVIGGGDMIKTVTFEKTTYADVPAKFEPGTPHIAGVLGLGAGIDYLKTFDLGDVRRYEKQILHKAMKVVGEIPGVRLVGTAEEKSSVVSFVVDGIHPHDVGSILDSEGVAVRTGHHCCQPVMDRLGLSGTVRASFCLYNDESDIAALVNGIRKAQEIFS